MPNPRRRHSPARKGHDRAHKKLAEKRYSECPHCHAAKQPHRICPSCGYYKERAVVTKVTA
jgi:large subunit ribosomal protein L32